MSYNVKISDEKGRILIKVKDDRVLVARFPKMTENMKKIIIEFYSEFTGDNEETIRGFLEFENDEMEFCS